MDNENKSAVEILGTALAEMMTRAWEAERQAKEEKARADEWYKRWCRKDEESKELQTALAAEIQGHKNTKVQLEAAERAIELMLEKEERIGEP
jgi:hypothetical protein